MKLRSDLRSKEELLSEVIKEKDQTIREQRKVIRRLLRKSLEDEAERSQINRGHSWSSTLQTIPDCDQGNITRLTQFPVGISRLWGITKILSFLLL